MKKKLGSILKVSAFIILVFVLFQTTTTVLIYKGNESLSVHNFYKEKRDSIDVLFVGTSHSYRSFSPMELWGNYGITSYNLGTSSQSIPSTYYLVKEGIRTQHPKVIVLELYGARYSDYFVSKEMLHSAVDYIPLNATKMEMINGLLTETLDEEEHLEYAFPIIRYHTRWKELTREDILGTETCFKGYQLINKQKQQKEPKLINKTQKPFEGTIEYFDKIVDLCEENNVELIACVTPMTQSKYYKKITKQQNWMIEYAQEQGIKTINYEQLRDEVGIDYTKDFYDVGHTNIYGARKLTNHIGKYLTEHYQIEDHKGEDGYENWDEDYAAYTSILDAS